MSKKMNKEKEDNTRMINARMTKRALDGMVSREVPVEGVPDMTRDPNSVNGAVIFFQNPTQKTIGSKAAFRL